MTSGSSGGCEYGVISTSSHPCPLISGVKLNSNGLKNKIVFFVQKMFINGSFIELFIKNVK